MDQRREGFGYSWGSLRVYFLPLSNHSLISQETNAFKVPAA